MGLSKIVLLAAFLTIGAANLVTFTPCDDSNEDVCKISEVRIDPCPKSNSCVFRQGSDASIAFDFTPNFSVSNLKTMVYWNQDAGDISFQGFGSDNGCDYTSCPTTAGQAQTLNYKLHVGRRLPTNPYHLKWKLWNPDNEDQKCCFKFNIKLTKAKKSHEAQNE